MAGVPRTADTTPGMPLRLVTQTRLDTDREKRTRMRETVVSGVGMTPFGRFEDRSLKDISAEAINAAFKDAGVTFDDIEAVFFGNTAAGVIYGQHAIRGETVTHHMGAGAIPVNNVENACASGGNAFHLGWSAVAGGQYNTVLVVGAEKLYSSDKAKSFSAFM